MRTGVLLIAVFLTLILATAPCSADSHGKFSGKGSIEAFNKAIDIANRALEFSKKGDYETAIKYDREAISIYPYDSGLFHNLGVNLLRVGKCDEARKAQEQATVLEPSYVGAWIAIGLTYEQEHKLTDAEKYYRKAVEIEPGYSGIFDLGDILRQQGRFKEAREWFLKAKSLANCQSSVSEVNSRIKQCDLKEASN